MGTRVGKSRGHRLGKFVQVQHSRSGPVQGEYTHRVDAFNPSRIASPTIRGSIGAGAIILLVAIGLWLVFHYRSIAPQESDTGTVPTERANANTSGTPNPNTETAANERPNPLKPSTPNPVAGPVATEHWNPRLSGSISALKSIFGTSDGKRLWVVGAGGTIPGSDDGGEHWNLRNSGTVHDLNSIFGTSDGKPLWAGGDKGTILESDDGGEHWNARKGAPGEQIGGAARIKSSEEDWSSLVLFVNEPLNIQRLTGWFICRIVRLQYMCTVIFPIRQCAKISWNCAE